VSAVLVYVSGRYTARRRRSDGVTTLLRDGLLVRVCSSLFEASRVAAADAGRNLTWDRQPELEVRS
jgi:hypothetical protein